MTNFYNSLGPVEIKRGVKPYPAVPPVLGNEPSETAGLSTLPISYAEPEPSARYDEAEDLKVVTVVLAILLISVVIAAIWG